MRGYVITTTAFELRGQFRYGNSGADCLFIGCPTRFVLSTISGSGFRQETIFPSFHFLMEFVYRVRQIIYIGDVFFSDTTWLKTRN